MLLTIRTFDEDRDRIASGLSRTGDDGLDISGVAAAAATALNVISLLRDRKQLVCPIARSLDDQFGTLALHIGSCQSERMTLPNGIEAHPARQHPYPHMLPWKPSGSDAWKVHDGGLGVGKGGEVRDVYTGCERSEDDGDTDNNDGEDDPWTEDLAVVVEL